MDRWPEIMLMIEAGMKNGEIFRGPPFSQLSCSASIVSRPPMPAPVTAPARSGSILLKSIPASVFAWMPAANPYCMNSSMRRASFGVMYCVRSKSRTAPPKRTGNADTSNRVIGPMPLCPPTMSSHAVLIVLPTGEMMPRPVTTTRRLLTRYLYEAQEMERPQPPYRAAVALQTVRNRAQLRTQRESGLVAALVDVFDRLLHRGDLFGVLIRNLDLELLFESHDELDGVE